MANPRIGTKRTDGKVYAGSHYGYQTPASFNKLKDDGELSKGSAVRRNIQQAVRPATQAVQNFQQDFRKKTDNIPGIKQLERGVNNASDLAGSTPAGRVAQGSSIVAGKAAKALDVDPKLVAAGLLVGRVALSGRGGTKPSSSFRPGTTTKLPTSARPTGTVRAGSSAPSKELTAARRSVIRPNTAQTARQAAGPAYPTSDPKQLAPGNSPARQSPSNFHTKEQLKKKAQTQHADMVERGYQGRVRRQPRGQDTSNYLPNRGRVSPTDKGKAAELARTHDERLAQALEGKRGPDRVAARNAFNREERRRVKDIRRDAIKQAQQYQSAQEAKLQKGSTQSSRESMAADIAKRPRTQPIRNTSTTTTGTRRIAANPESGTNRRGVVGRVVTNSNGEVTIRNNKGNLTNNPRSRTNFDDQVPGNRVAGRSINPATGRPYQDRGNEPTKVSTKKPSASTRQPRGGNPAENFSAETRARTPLARKPSKSAPTTIDESTSAFQNLTPGERHRVSPGLAVVSRQPDGRVSGGSGLRGTSTQDTRQRRNGRNIGRLGQAGQSNIDTPELRKRAAANKERAADTSKPTPTPPKRTPERAAQIRQQSRATSQSVRATRGMSDREVKALQNKYNRDFKEIKDKENARRVAAGKQPNMDSTHFNGEVRLQGSKYSMDPQARSLVDGSVSRTTGRARNQGRSADASAASKRTMEAVRARKAAKKAADRIINGRAKSTVRNGRKQVKGSGQYRQIKPSDSTQRRRSLLNRFRSLINR